jgi:hypothetical protein
MPRWSFNRSDMACGGTAVQLIRDRDGPHEGRWSDDVRMAMIREEWLALDRPRSWDLAAAEVEARGAS